jgi:DNA invertase Pin-like site-specific DNA recombinase
MGELQIEERPMTRQPVAYIRRSAADTGSPGDVSRAVQEQAIADLAKREGHNGEVRWFVDWARSADEEKTAQRSQYAALLAAVERDEVSTVYAYSLDRLLRSVVMTGKLLKATKDRGVRIVTQREGDLSDDGNPSKWLYTMLVSAFSEYELRMVKQRSAAALARRRERGDFLGNAPYGHKLARDADGRVIVVPDPDSALPAVLEVVRATGSILEACRVLERRHVPAPNGGKRWSMSALTRIVEREAPELLRPRGPTGRRGAKVTHPLAGLLRCHCSATLTPNVTRGQFYCNRGHVQGAAAHGKFNLSVSNIMPWVAQEAARFTPPADVVQLGEASAEERAALERQREQLGWAVADGLLDREKAKARADEIDAALAALDLQEQLVDVPESIDWRWPADRLNRILRTYWSHIELDERLRPVRAEWRSGLVDYLD